MAHATSRDGTRIAYDRQGGGAPVILVGGATQYRALDLRTGELAGLLARRLTVVNYDRRGRGDSGDTPPYAVEREVEDIAALISEAGGSAALFGNSSGATLAIEAVAAGLPVTRLAVYEAPYVVDDSRPPIPEDLAARFTELVESGRRGDAVELFMTAVAMAPPEMVGGMRAMPFWGGFEAVAHTLAYDMILGGDNRVPRAAHAVTIPALVLDGGASPPWLHGAAAALTEALPGGRRRTLDGQAHDVAPGVLAPVLIEFFGGESG